METYSNCDDAGLLEQRIELAITVLRQARAHNWGYKLDEAIEVLEGGMVQLPTVKTVGL